MRFLAFAVYQSRPFMHRADEEHATNGRGALIYASCIRLAPSACQVKIGVRRRRRAAPRLPGAPVSPEAVSPPGLHGDLDCEPRRQYRHVDAYGRVEPADDETQSGSADRLARPDPSPRDKPRFSAPGIAPVAFCEQIRSFPARRRHCGAAHSTGSNTTRRGHDEKPINFASVRNEQVVAITRCAQLRAVAQVAAFAYRDALRSEIHAHLLIQLDWNCRDFPERALINRSIYLDIDSAIPRFESWRPSQSIYV
jgi:hypothetical protein